MTDEKEKLKKELPEENQEEDYQEEGCSCKNWFVMLDSEKVTVSLDFLKGSVAFVSGFKVTLAKGEDMYDIFLNDLVKLPEQCKDFPTVFLSAVNAALNAVQQDCPKVPLIRLIQMIVHNHYMSYLSKKYFGESTNYTQCFSVFRSQGFCCEGILEDFDTAPYTMYVDKEETEHPVSDDGAKFTLSKKYSDKAFPITKDQKEDHDICLLITRLREELYKYLNSVGWDY